MYIDICFLLKLAKQEQKTNRKLTQCLKIYKIISFIK